jgi:hypothetical protein
MPGQGAITSCDSTPRRVANHRTSARSPAPSSVVTRSGAPRDRDRCSSSQDLLIPVRDIGRQARAGAAVSVLIQRWPLDRPVVGDPAAAPGGSPTGTRRARGTGRRWAARPSNRTRARQAGPVCSRRSGRGRASRRQQPTTRPLPGPGGCGRGPRRARPARAPAPRGPLRRPTTRPQRARPCGRLPRGRRSVPQRLSGRTRRVCSLLPLLGRSTSPAVRACTTAATFRAGSWRAGASRAPA